MTRNLCFVLTQKISFFILPGAGLNEVPGMLIPRSVKTEAPPAGDFGRRSGRSFGRGSSGRNSEYPVLTGPPVLARAPAISRSVDQI